MCALLRNELSGLRADHGSPRGGRDERFEYKGWARREMEITRGYGQVLPGVDDVQIYRLWDPSAPPAPLLLDPEPSLVSDVYIAGVLTAQPLLCLYCILRRTPPYPTNPSTRTTHQDRVV